MSPRRSILRVMAVSCLLVVFLMMVMGLAAINEVRSLSDLSRQMYRHPFTVSNGLLEANVNILEMRQHLLEAVLAPTREELESSAVHMTEHEALVYKHIETVGGAFLGPPSQIETLVKSFADWKPIRSEILDLLRTGRLGEARLMVMDRGKGEKHFLQLSRQVDGLIAFARAKADELASKSQAATNRSLAILVVMIVAISLLTMIIFVFTTKKSNRVHAQLSESEARLRLIVDSVPVGLTFMDLDETYRHANKGYQDLLGLATKDLIGKTAKAVVGEKTYKIAEPYIRRALAGEKVRHENTFFPDDGRVVSAVVDYIPYRQPDGEVAGFFALIQDVTEKERAERELRESEARFRELYEHTPVMMHSTDNQGRVVDVSDHWLDRLGYARDDVIGKPLLGFLSEKSKRLVEGVARPKFRETGKLKNLEVEFVRSDGEIRLVSVSSQAKYAADGSFLNSRSVLEDITERRRADEALRESELRLREAQRIAQIGSWEFDIINNSVKWSDEVYRIYGLEPQEFDATYEAFLDSVHPDDRELVNKTYTESVENKTPQNFVHRLLLRDGTLKFVNERGETFYDEDGKAIRSVGTVQDVTERRSAEQALEESEQRLSLAIDNMTVGVAVIGEDGAIREFNSRAEYIFGYRAEEVLGKNVRMLMPEPYQSEHDQHLRSYLDSGIKKIIGVGREVTGLRKDGETFPMRLGVGEIKTATGSLFVGSIGDLSEIKRLETQLRHSQKMDAIGQLTGGIAHDFNNLLGIIMGNLEILLNETADNSKMVDRIQKAIRGAERGASLTKKLLGFSRQGSVETKLTNINAFVESLHELITKSLTPSIKVEQLLAADLWPVEIDPGDLEDAVLNLALNARDAMPNGGTLLIETANKVLDEEYARRNPNARAGEFVMLSLSDTGSGMTDVVSEKIFEPFFTTKEQGKGTGLGLSMVYGFVQRSGGHAKIYSELGKGTTIHIYLPRSQEKEIRDEKRADFERGVPHGSETILVVDDEEELADVAVAILESIGYRTLTTTDGERALKILEDNKDIGLVFSDVIMPGRLDGYELARAARKINPSLKILLTSGFSRRREELANGEDSHEQALAGKLLHKPYNQSELATAIRQTLDEEEADGT